MAEPPGVAPASGQLRFERAGVRILSSAHGPGVDEVPEWQAFHRWLLEETARLTNVGGWSYDLTTGAVYWTAQTARIHDIEPGAVVDAEGALRHFTPESKAWLESAISAAAAYAEPFDLELDLVSEAGRLKRVRVLGHVAVDDGRAVRVYGSVQDVTEARRAERELSDAHTFLDTVVDMMPFPMCICDATGSVVRANVALCRSLGLPPERFLRHYNVLADGNFEAAGVMPRVRAVFERRQPVRFGLAWSGAASGHAELAHVAEQHLEMSLFPIVDGDGGLANVVCQWVDVTESVRAHHALRLSEQRFKDTLLNLDEGYFRVSEDGVLLEHNRALNRILGYPEERDLRGSPSPQFWLDPSERARYEALLVEKGSIRNFIMDSRALSGEVLTLQVSAHLERAADGGRVIEGAFSDITELKRAGEEIRRMNQELEQRVAERTARLEAANKELEAFAHSVSHDLRAPLRAIGGLSRMILDEHADGLDDEGRRLFGSVVENAGKMDQLIVGLLELTQLSLDERDLVTLDMSALMADVLTDIIQDGAACSIDFLVSPLPPARGDRTLMRQVWVNLLGNAVKFSSGAADPVIAVGSYVHQGMNVYFVKDNGVGFDPMYESRLFGIFQRLHRAGEFPGTGVGLAIVRRIIDLHHGIVWAKGEVGGGAIFSFALPTLGGDA